MACVKRVVSAHKKRRTTLECASGYRGQRSHPYCEAKEQVTHFFMHSYRDRKARKGDFRKLRIAHINAACRARGMIYSCFIQGLRLTEVEVGRRMLAELVVSDITAFNALVKAVRGALPKDVNRPATWVAERVTRSMLERRETLDNSSSVKMRRIAGLSRRFARLKSSLIRIEGARALCEALRSVLDSVEDVYFTEAAGVSEPELSSLVEAASMYGHWVSERVARVVAETAQGWFVTVSFAVFPPLHGLRGCVALTLPET